MKCVIDTNVLVAGSRSRSGSSFQLLQEVLSGSVIPVVSVALFLEYEDVLKRPGLLPAQFSMGVIDRFLDVFLNQSQTVKVLTRWRPYLNDPNDEMVLEAAISGGSIPIVTYNVRDFVKAEELGIRVITPDILLAELSI